MKISFNPLIFKTLLLLSLTSITFIIFIVFSAKQSFSKGYIHLTQEDMYSIAKNLSPSVSISLSYGLKDAIDEIVRNQLKNKKILLIKIDSVTLEKALIFSNVNKSIEELKEDGHFISTSTLQDPLTANKLGDMTLVYSNESYKTYMQNFYEWFGLGASIFILSIIIFAYILYRILKHILDETHDLNETISQKEIHLKDAQRMAKVGSWEYNIIDNTLLLSDEVYRMLGVKFGTHIGWNDFLNFISKDDYTRVIKIMNNAIENGSRFNVKYALTLKNDRQIHVQTRAKVRKKQGGNMKITAVSMNITNDIKNKKTIEKLAYYDSLTGLANRALLKDRMHKAIQHAKREKSSLAIIFLDLDHFKLINDTLGHSVGDELLIYIAEVLKSQIRASDTLARIGGDEFVILLPSMHSSLNAKNIASKIQKTLQNKHSIGPHQLYITSSIGVSIYPEHGENGEELIRNADTAMYEAKNCGRNDYKIYSTSMGNYVDKQLHLEQDLIQAVHSKTPIEVFYQPKIDSVSNFIAGAEALVRWNHPTKGLIYPDDFIHIAESTGLMVDLGNIIIEESIHQLQEWNKLGLAGLKIAINLSARQFQDSNLVSFISSMINKYQIDPLQLEFEITETISMVNMSNTLRILEELKEIGVSIAIDDFGTGHSSLAYLKKFPINTLKIDRSFVIGIIENEEDEIIVQTIISMAHSLGFDTVAEGVETLQQVKLLQNMDCDQLQGFYFSEPIPKDKFTKYLQDYIPNN